MKKILIASNVLLLTVILFMACNDSPQKKDSVKAADSNTARPAARDTAADDEVMSGLIDDNLAIAMSEAYKNDRNKAYVTGTNEPDARSIWFSLSKLKAFIRKIEESTAGTRNDLHLGVRMYYAKYPSLEEMNNKYPALLNFSKIAGKHTLFMTPTYNIGKGDVDFNFENVGNRDEPTPYTVLLSPAHGRGVRNNIFSNLQKPRQPQQRPGEPVPRVENHGGLMPPPASGGTFPTGEEEQ